MHQRQIHAPAQTDALTEFEEWRVEQACKLIRRCEADLKRHLSDGERRDLLMDNTHWAREQIVDAVTAIRLNGGDVGEG